MTGHLAKAEDSVLLFVDVQDKFLAAMATDVGQSLIRQAGILAQAAQILDIPILSTLQYPQGLGPMAAALAESLPANHVSISKICFSGADAVHGMLQQWQRRQIIIAGV